MTNNDMLQDKTFVADQAQGEPREAVYSVPAEIGKPEDKMIEQFICPITLGIMVDPVIASDGHSYERSAI